MEEGEMSDLIQRLRSVKWREAHIVHVGLIREAAVALEAAEKDAARYRWLRDNITYTNIGSTSKCDGTLITPLSRRWYHDSKHLGANTIDAAIDAAMEAEK
jgi:hypothetical protein